MQQPTGYTCRTAGLLNLAKGNMYTALFMFVICCLQFEATCILAKFLIQAPRSINEPKSAMTFFS